MRAELHYDGGVERIDLPESSICGISVVSPDGKFHMEAVNIGYLDSDYLEEADTSFREIERVTAEGIRIRLLCWTVPELRFIPDIMAAYPGMKYIEVRESNIAVNLIC